MLFAAEDDTAYTKVWLIRLFIAMEKLVRSLQTNKSKDVRDMINHALKDDAILHLYHKTLILKRTSV